MKKVIILFAFLFPISIFAEIVKINYGTNSIDLNNDGIKDLIIKTDRESGTAHGYIMYSFAIKQNDLYKNIEFEGKNLVKEKPGADCNESAVQIEKTNDKFYLTKISLDEPDFENNENFASLRTAIKRKYILNAKGLVWDKISDEKLSGKYCELNNLF
ncbi:MAG: hypothetical protein LBB23_00930 [Rickettsiales bacterium]|nr:hypothetical protein [Rickettsiales bacterium]